MSISFAAVGPALRETAGASSAGVGSAAGWGARPAEDAPAVSRKAGPTAAKLIDISADDFDDDED